jgi:hypothetical protein
MSDIIKLPKSFKVGGIEYEVRRIPIADDGEILFGQSIVNINENLCQDKAEEALFHEWVESVNEAYGLKLPHYKIQILGSAVHQFAKDNNFNWVVRDEKRS